MIISLAAIAGGAFSLAVELAQMGFPGRDPSAFDVLANTLGAGCGAELAALWPSRTMDLAYRYLAGVEKAGIFMCMAILLAAWPLVVSAAQWIAPFGIWNSQYSLQIANEATLDRPWLGKIHFVGLYNRALSAEEVKNNFDQRHELRSIQERLPAGLISVYTFSEGQGNIAHDLSGLKPAVDLSMSSQAGVRWLDGSHGIEIVEPAIVQSREPATKLVRAFGETHELSIEVWLTPRDIEQEGSARIVSLSRNTRARNFTLGQQGSKIQFRLRTPISGRNGMPLALETTDELLADEKSHVVATYKDGVENLYINGAAQAHVLDLTSDGIIGLATNKTPIALAAYSFFYFFPVSFLFAAFLSRRSNGWMARLLPLAISAGLCAATELFQVIVFARTADYSVILWSVFMAGFGTFGGRAFASPERCEKVFFWRGSLAG